MSSFYDELNFPKENLVDKNIQKEKIISSNNSFCLSDSLKQAFMKYVDEINIKYIFKSSFSQKSKNTDLILMEVSINNSMCVYDVATVIGRVISYPVIIFFNYKGRVKTGLIKNRINSKNYVLNKIVDIKLTGWLKVKSNYGRRNEFFKKFKYDNMYDENLDIMVNNYLKLLEEYESKHIELNSAVKFIQKMKLPYNREIKKDILIHCVHVKVNDDISTQLEMFKTSRLDKYEKDGNNKFMICRDEFYSYLQKKYEELKYSYNDYVEYLNSLYEMLRVEEAKKNRTSFNCKYYDQFSGACMRENMYECIEPQKCEYYKKRKDW